MSAHDQKECVYCGGVFFRRIRSNARWASARFCSLRCTMRSRHADLPGRLAARTERSVGCWEWMGDRNANGYGRIIIRGRSTFVHRLSYELSVGPIPEGMSVCHHCDNPPCVRPDHLWLGTFADNMRDMFAKGRHARGERNGRAMLTEAEVRAIRSALSVGGRNRDIAARFGVDPSQISHIKHRRVWASLCD